MAKLISPNKISALQGFYNLREFYKIPLKGRHLKLHSYQ